MFEMSEKGRNFLGVPRSVFKTVELRANSFLVLHSIQANSSSGR